MNDIDIIIVDQLKLSLESIYKIISQQKTIIDIANLMSQTISNDKTIYLCGNGGSSSDAHHVAGELVGRFLKERRPVSAIALSSNTSVLTSIGNDYNFDSIFSRQVEAHVKKDDCVVGISTSGKSVNIMNAIHAAKKLGAKTIGFTGLGGEDFASICDLSFVANSSLTPHIQETHIIVWHIICNLIEKTL